MSNLYDGRITKDSKHCRWCGVQYYAAKPHGRDGFHIPACKQAHYRAFHKWVTTRPPPVPGAAGKTVTRKKRKK